jgi:internalin A
MNWVSPLAPNPRMIMTENKTQPCYRFYLKPGSLELLRESFGPEARIWASSPECLLPQIPSREDQNPRTSRFWNEIEIFFGLGGSVSFSLPDLDPDCEYEFSISKTESHNWIFSINDKTSLFFSHEAERTTLQKCPDKNIFGYSVIPQFVNRLSNLDGLSDWPQLTQLRIPNCSELMDLSGLLNMENLSLLNLSGCKSLDNLKVLEPVISITELYLLNCESLSTLDGISRLQKLSKLELATCKSLENVDALSGLASLRSLNLAGCSSLTTIQCINDLASLEELTLSYCTSLQTLNGLSGMLNLAILNLAGCSSLSEVNELNHLLNLRNLDLHSCTSLTSLSGIENCRNLESLDLKKCYYLKDLEPLKSLKKLRELEYEDPVIVVRILSHTAREDAAFLRKKSDEAIEVATKTTEPEPLVCDLADAFGRHAARESESIDEDSLGDLEWDGEEWKDTSQWACSSISKLVYLMLDREGSAESTWASLLGAVAKCPDEQAQEILQRVVDEMNQERASSILRSFLKTLASLPESLGEWANERADELLDSLDIDFLRDYGPSVCLFYARMGREDLLRSWLEKLTDPETPLWRDRIHLALGQWEIGRGDLDSPRARLKEMSQGASKDELLETLARAMAKEKPLEAGELLDQISEEWRQASLSAELAEEAAFTEPAENAYRLLLHMERDPDKLADWVGALTHNHPDSELVKEVARTFGPGDQGARALSELLSDLLEKEVIARATKESQLKSFKEELLADGETEDFLLEALIGCMCKRGLVDEEEAKQLLENLRGEKE